MRHFAGRRLALVSLTVALVAGLASYGAITALRHPASSTTPQSQAQNASLPSAGSTPPAADGATEIAIDAAHLDLIVFGQFPVSPDGAIGTNRSAWHSVGFQRPLGGHVIHGLATHDVAELSSAITAMEYSFQHQNPDGSFQVVQIPGAGFQLNPVDIVGTVFFYGDLGHALMLLQDSPWFQSDPATAALRQRLGSLRPAVDRGMRWLTDPAQQRTVQSTGRHDTNRATFGAEAYLLTGEWLGDNRYVSIGEGLLQQVEGNLQPDGTILEKGGFDSGYQTVSLDNLWHIYFHLDGTLASLRAPAWNVLVKGTARETRSVEATGEISHSGNSRTYCGGETFRGKQKQGSGRDATRIFAYMGGVTGNAALIRTAQSIVTFYDTNTNHNLCALPS